MTQGSYTSKLCGLESSVTFILIVLRKIKENFEDNMISKIQKPALYVSGTDIFL
jgi:hypothetical protein